MVMILVLGNHYVELTPQAFNPLHTRGSVAQSHKMHYVPYTTGLQVLQCSSWP